MILNVKFKACQLMSSRPFASGSPNSTPQRGTGNLKPMSKPENWIPWVSAHAKPTPVGSPRSFESLCFAIKKLSNLGLVRLKRERGRLVKPELAIRSLRIELDFVDGTATVLDQA